MATKTKTANGNENVKRVDPKDKLITKLTIASVSEKREFVSPFKTDKDGKPVIEIGHFFEFEQKTDRGLISLGKRFISDKWLKEIRQYGNEQDSNPKHLTGCKCRFVGLVLVDEGEQFIPWSEDGKAGEETAQRDLIMANSLSIEDLVTAGDRKQVMMDAMREAVKEQIDVSDMIEMLNS